MGASDLILNNMEAFTLREEQENGQGKRIIRGDKKSDLIPDWLEAIGGVVWDSLLKVGGFILGSLVSALSFTFTKAWSWAVSTAQFLWTFNWNASDEQLDQRLDSLGVLLSAQLGGTLGNLAGYLVCGVAPGAVMLKFNKMLAVRILKEVGEEALDELAGNLLALTTSALNALTQTALISMFKSTRRWIKKASEDPDSLVSRVGRFLVGEKYDDAVRAWGDGKSVWSFSQAFEDAIDSIPNEKIRAGVEEFFEEFAESCIEAGYIVAGELDEWASQRKLENQGILGEEKIVEITPNRDQPEEKLLLAGSEELVKNALPVVLSTHQQIDNRDLGQWVGEPLRENLRRAKRDITLRLLLYNQEAPPFQRSGVSSTRVQITLPGVKRSALDWEKIKFALGGINGYNWGRFKTITKLIDDQGDFAGMLTIYGATANESQQITQNLLLLTDYTPATQDTTEELKTYRRGAGRALAKESTRVYPAYVTVINPQKVINEDEGRATLSGAYKYRRNRLELFTSSKPPDFDDVIRELLYTPGADL